MTGVEIDLTHGGGVEIYTAGFHERQSSVDPGGDRLVLASCRTRSYELLIPMVDLTQIRITPTGECAKQVQRRSRGLVCSQEPPWIGLSGAGLEVHLVDDVASETRKFYLATRLGAR